MEVKRFDILWVSLDPTVGSEIQKSRPAVVVSPNEMNKALKTIIVAPITSTMKQYPTRVDIELQGKTGQVALDQIRTIDKQRIKRKIEVLEEKYSENVLELLQVMFAK